MQRGAVKSSAGPTPIAEFAELNRRRVFGNPGLSIAEVERWQELREVLAEEFGEPEPEATLDDDERRGHVRHASHIRVVVNDAEQGIAMDISLGGIFIATPRPLPTGSQISLELQTYEFDEPVVIQGCIVRVEAGGKLSGRVGMGIMFAGLDATQASRVKQMCGHLEQGA
ncbi:MAG: PilZ domain-containing protein [bacterium]|nr:PilZ domain-containing protein [bacterium]